MSNTIPYHPSLTLGNIITPSLMQKFQNINAHLKEIDKVKERLDSLLLTYRNIDTTQKQIKSLDVNIATDSLKEYQNKIKENIEKAANQYIKIKIQKEEEIQNIDLSDDNNNLFSQSPLNYSKVGEQYLPWSTDSLKLDYQYFSFKGNQQDSKTIDNIKSFLATSTADLDNPTQAQKMSEKVLNKFQDQHEKLNIEGTLIISATCTHKNVMMIDPFVLDIHKTISIWNKIYKDDLINIRDIELNNLKDSDAVTGNCFDIISGAIYGSCFIGMVHLVKINQTYSNKSEGNFENGNALIKNIREKLKLEKWFAHQLGNVDIDPSQKRHIKNLLSNEEISIHLNIFVTGSAPTIAANDLESSLKSFSNIDFSKFKIKTEDSVSYQETSEKSRLESHEISIHNAISSNILFKLSEIEKQKNKVLDINTMITAFTNYVKNITEDHKKSAFGVPISYYIRSYTKSDIIELWLKTKDTDIKNKES